jgi:hypothetical protein
VFRAAKDGEEARRLLEEVGEPFALLLEFPDQARALLLQALAVGDVPNEGLPAAVGEDGSAYLCGEGGAVPSDEVPLLDTDASVEKGVARTP